MLSSFIFLVIITVFKADARGQDNDPVEITFQMQLKSLHNGTFISCDHNDNNKNQNQYTVFEGEQFIIIIKYDSFINYLTCNDYNNMNNIYAMNGGLKKAYITAKKNMGTLWNCTILAHQDNLIANPFIVYQKHLYSVAYCYMKIHVRQRKSPQTILVNNMVLQTVRTNLSEKDVDFTADYQYADGDVVHVTCFNFLYSARLTMEYAKAGTTSDNSTMADPLFIAAKLHSGHNNSYMLCINTESTDYTKVMVRFVMRTGFNIVNVRINGMTVRPQLKHAVNHRYEIEYKYLINRLINVVCEVQRTDMNLLMVDMVGPISNYNAKRELIPTKKAEMSFFVHPYSDMKLDCFSYYISGAGTAEQVAVTFIHFPNDEPSSNSITTNGHILVYCMTAGGVGVIIIQLAICCAVKKSCCSIKSRSQELPPVPTPTPHPNTAYYENLLSVFQVINEREAAELENHYEEIQ